MGVELGARNLRSIAVSPAEVPVNFIEADTPPRGKCGITAVSDPRGQAGFLISAAQYNLQHRGQDSAGLTVFNPGVPFEKTTHVDFGLVPNVMTVGVLKDLGDSEQAIGHNRYRTSGESTLDSAGPVVGSYGDYSLSLAHNGNIPDDVLEHIKEKVQHVEPSALTDTGWWHAYLLEQRENFSSWEETFVNVLSDIPESYCFTAITEDGSIWGGRDRYGVMPLSLGRLKNGGWIIASESVAFDAVKNAKFSRDVARGELIQITPEGDISSRFFGEPKREKICFLQYVYFARPDSLLGGRSVRNGREEMGRRTADRFIAKGIEVDAVVPVFDSGYPSAKGLAQRLGGEVEALDAITTSHYVGRAFIQDGQANREAAVVRKHNVDPKVGLVRYEYNEDGTILRIGKRILVNDDTVVRGATLRGLASDLNDEGVAETNISTSGPPVTGICDQGIFMDNKRDQVAGPWRGKPLEEIEKRVARELDINSMTYLPIEEGTAAIDKTPDCVCYNCFGGPHPMRDDIEVFPQKERPIVGKAKITVLISGEGTNLQALIDQTEAGAIDAEITHVISNKPDVPGLQRAATHNIPQTVIDSQGKYKDSEKRAQYNRELAKHIENLPEDQRPDGIVLAGFGFVLDDDFLLKMQGLEIPVLNLHPALLTEGEEKEVMTSKGLVPVIRGAHAIKDAFDLGLPVSGVTIHQLLPGNNFDVGPIILKEEVHRRRNDTFENWEARIRDAEYRALPTAVKRAVHIMKEGVDISKGEFPW